MLGSHNTMSYLPIKGWRRLLKLWIKCQSLTIQEQYNFGIRYFDLRVKLINNEWHLCHNKADFGTLNKQLKDIKQVVSSSDTYFRIILDERKKPKRNIAIYKHKFFSLCDNLKNIGFNIDSVIIYWEWKEYECPKIELHEYHASVSASWYQYILGTKWFAKHYNKYAKEIYYGYAEDNERVLLLNYTNKL